MNLQKYKILSGFLLLLVLLVVGFMIFFRGVEVSQTPSEVGSLPPTEESAQQDHKQVGVEELFQPIIKQVEPVVSYYTDVFDVFSVSKNPKKSERIFTLEAPFEIKTNITFAQTPFKRPLQSTDPLFSSIWPDFYIDYLSNMQNLMIDTGVYSEAKYNFETESEIFEFLSEFLEFIRAEKIIEEEDYKNIKHGLEIELPQSQTMELRELQKKAAIQYVIQQILSKLYAPNAHAQIIGDPISPGGEDCYKDVIPEFPIPGLNLWAPCCDCCIPTTGECIPIGCLNAVCSVWPNAIWDPATGICGCG